MHIKLLYRKVLCVFLSLMIVFANTQTAFASSSWAMQSISSSGASAVISAAKTGFRSTITHAPSAAAVGRALVAGAGIGAFAYAASQLLGAGVDYVMTSGGDIKYKSGTGYENPEDVCRSTMSSGWTYRSYRKLSEFGYMCVASYNNGSPVDYQSIFVNPTAPEDKIIPLSQVADKVIANAAAGHTPSQEAIRSAAAADFNTGSLDSKLQDTAVPSDAPYDAPDNVVPFDPSSIISALQSLMSAVTNMSSSLSAKIQTMISTLSGKMDEMIGKQTETNQVINDGMADVVAANNATGARVGDVVAAIEALEGNTLDGQVINDAIDRAIAAGHTDAASIVAAIEAIEGNTLDGQVINDAVDKVITNDNINAQATQDVVSQSIDEAIEASHVDTASVTDAVGANASAVTDAIGAQTDAMTQADPVTGETSLKLPTFCGWAGTVCDYMDWVKGEYQTMSDFVRTEPETMPDEPVVVADDPSGLGGIFQDKAEAGYVSFSRECPANVLIPVSLMGASQVLNISYAGFCHFASLIRPAVILGAWISGLLIISGGRARE